MDPFTDPSNLVLLSHQFHKFIHSRLYIDAINAIFTAVELWSNAAYPDDQAKLQYNVRLALDMVADVLVTADPFK